MVVPFANRVVDTYCDCLGKSTSGMGTERQVQPDGHRGPLPGPQIQDVQGCEGLEIAGDQWHTGREYLEYLVGNHEGRLIRFTEYSEADIGLRDMIAQIPVLDPFDPLDIRWRFRQQVANFSLFLAGRLL